MSVSDLPRYDFCHVESLAALCDMLSSRNGKGMVLLAGGTDFMVEVSQGAPRRGALPLVVDISRMPELGGIDWDGTRLRIGAAVSYLELARHAAVAEHAPLLAAMTYDIGGPTIQARGTLGGNFATASPAADGVAAIAAFDPIIEVQSVRGRRRIAMADLQTGYKTSTRADDEVIVAFELEPPPPGTPWVWRKVGTRMAQAISKVALAAVAQIDDGVVTRFGAAMASVAPVTALLPNVRKLMTGARVDEVDAAALDAAVEADVAPIDDVRSTREYRAHCAKALVRSFVISLRH
ncbi:MAG TPA: FAD binding domain-containing protein [Polyangiaceae bacterium]|nr:FAD binding domain-containing protein [Polyangiaceae bacterium]